MQRVTRGIEVPSGTAGQENAAVKCFHEFMSVTRMSYEAPDGMNKSVIASTIGPARNFYTLFQAFSIFLQTQRSAHARDPSGLLSKATATAYFSQILNLLKERYPHQLQDAVRLRSIRSTMSTAIAQRSLFSNIQINAAPGCTAQDLHTLVEELAFGSTGDGRKDVHDAAVLVMMWHTIGRAIDTSFLRKRQLSVAASGEVFLQLTRIKTTTLQGVSLFKSASHWQQCVLHGLGMLWVCSNEPSEFVFPMIPCQARSDLPGEEARTQQSAFLYWELLQSIDETGSAPVMPPPSKRARVRPKVANYLNSMLQSVDTRLAQRLGKQLSARLTSHSLRRGSAAYANASPKLAIQWISTRGAWVLDSLSKVFAYIGTTTKEDQVVGKVLAGYQDPTFPVSTPSVKLLYQQLPPHESYWLRILRGQLFASVIGYPNISWNVDDDVVDICMAALLLHLYEVKCGAEDSSSGKGVVSFYLCSFSAALEATSRLVGYHLTFSLCISWGEKLAQWRLAQDYLHDGGAHQADGVAGLKAILSQVLNTMRTLQESVDALRPSPTDNNLSASQPMKKIECARSATPPTSLAGCFFEWYEQRLWIPAATKNDQQLRSDMKACVNIMLVASAIHVVIPERPLSTTSDGSWKAALWETASTLDTKTNANLSAIDGKRRTNKPASLRKRWAGLRSSHADKYRSLVETYVQLLKVGGIEDSCMPEALHWREGKLLQ